MENIIHLSTSEKSIIDDVWSIKSDGVELEQAFYKSELPIQIHDITAYIEDATVLLTFIAALINLVKSKKHSAPTQPTINIHLHKTDEKIIQFIHANKGEINVNVHTKNGESGD